ncbi:MAG TPA: GNAT family protein [Ktedonobacterales bacterium]|nr:GNAT family protein [Ktedonobacterales bacterium]
MSRSKTSRATEPDRKEGSETENTAPIINIYGDHVGLGPSTRAQLPIMARWDNDFTVTLLSGDRLAPHYVEEYETDYEHYAKNEWRDWVGFSIYELATLRFIGVTDLRHMDAIGRGAEFGIEIGEKDCWGKGYGTETTILMLDYGFNVRSLHNVMLTTYSYNARAIRAYTRAGFREFGRRRECARWGGRVYDEVYMDCLATEFTSPLRPIVAALDTPTAPAAAPPERP